MALRDQRRGWGLVSRLLHWVMAGLILFQLGLGVYMVRQADLFRRFDLTQLHKSWGTVIFALALLRLGWRALAGPRPDWPEMPAWQRRGAAGLHGVLYGLMLLLPLSGWVMASASPTQDLLQMQNRVFDVFALPDPWVPGNAAVEAAARTVHTGAALLLAATLLLHGGAALWHQGVRRDGLLTRMIRGA